MPSLLLLFFILTFAYIIGSLPTSYWLCRLISDIDITKHGSGNSGASNAARVLGAHMFVPVALLDAGKAYATLALSSWLLPATLPCCGTVMVVAHMVVVALLIGNGYSPFLGFRGGKGVATTVGILWHQVAWPISTAFMLAWLFLVALLKRPFLASFGALAVAWAVALATGVLPYRELLLIVTIWMAWRHAGNVASAF